VAARCSAAAPCNWAVICWLAQCLLLLWTTSAVVPAQTHDPWACGWLLPPMGSPGSTLMTEGRYGLTSVIISEVRWSHNTAGGHRHTWPEPTAGGAASAHRRGAQHTNNTRTQRRGGGGQQAASAHRRGAQHRRAGGPSQGRTTRAQHRGGHKHTRKGAAPTRQQTILQLAADPLYPAVSHCIQLYAISVRV